MKKHPLHTLCQVLLLIVALLVPRPSSADNKPPDNLCDVADQVIKQVSLIRQLKMKSSVPCLVHNKEEVEQFLRDSIKTKVPVLRLRMEEAVYKTLGFIPEDYAYETGIINLYLSQIGGYYDPEKAHYVMAGWMPVALQGTIASHELTHALQDQYYNLKTFVDMKNQSSDELLARSSLVEGDANTVMYDMMLRQSGQSGIKELENVDQYILQNALGASLMGGAPQSLQLMLLFPYTSGLRFTHTLLRKGGYAEIDKAFANPPRSSEEILHPEKYMKQSADFTVPTEAEARALDTEIGERKAIYHDAFGEFGLSALLGMLSSEKLKAADAAAGWGGDMVYVFGKDDTTPERLVWIINWDDQKEREQFWSLYLPALEAKYPEVKGKLEDKDKWQLLKSGRKIKAYKSGDTKVILLMTL